MIYIRAYIVLFSGNIFALVTRLPQAVIYHLDIGLEDAPAWAYAWFLVLGTNFVIVSFIGCVILNSLLVIPSSLHISTEQPFKYLYIFNLDLRKRGGGINHF